MRALRRAMRAVFLLGLALAALFVGFLALWAVEPPVSTLMMARHLTGRPVVRGFPRRCQPPS